MVVHQFDTGQQTPCYFCRDRLGREGPRLWVVFRTGSPCRRIYGIVGWRHYPEGDQRPTTLDHDLMVF